MLIAITGTMGAGKTLTMSVLASYLQAITQAPLFANYPLKNSQQIRTWQEVLAMNSGIFAFDEAHVTMDSRNFKDRTSMVYTRWLTQLRKKQLLMLYTTQHINQVDIRLRNLTDILIMCQQHGRDGIRLQFIDWQYLTAGRRYVIPRKSLFYDLYDTYALVTAIEIHASSTNKKFTPRYKFRDE